MYQERLIRSGIGAAHNGSMSTLVSDQARTLLRALADPLRLQVIEALAGGERCVCDLTADLELAQSKLSFHLKVMRQAGLIDARQQGRWMYYRLRPQALADLAEWLAALAGSCQRPAPPCAADRDP